MANFSIPNLPGASPVYNKIASKVDSIEKDVMSKLEVDASALASSLTADFTDLKAKTLSMIPKLPSLPSLNLQAEITSLATLAPTSGAYAVKLASIGTSFGGAISAGGYSLDSVVSSGASALKELANIAAGGIPSLTGGLPTLSSLSAAIPNMELPAGATEAIEVAKAALQPDTDVLKEAASAFSTDKTENETKAVYGDVVSKKEQESVQVAAAAAPAAAEAGEQSEYERLDALLQMQRAARRVEGLRVKYMKSFVDAGFDEAETAKAWQARTAGFGLPGQTGVNPHTDGRIPVPMPSPDNIITWAEVLAAA